MAAQFLGVPPIISGTGKATDFKFGEYIYRANLNKKDIKNSGENGAWAYPGAGKMFRVPPIISGTVKLRTSNFVTTLTGSIGTKARVKCWE